MPALLKIEKISLKLAYEIHDFDDGFLVFFAVQVLHLPFQELNGLGQGPLGDQRFQEGVWMSPGHFEQSCRLLFAVSLGVEGVQPVASDSPRGVVQDENVLGGLQQALFL